MPNRLDYAQSPKQTPNRNHTINAIRRERTLPFRPFCRSYSRFTEIYNYRVLHILVRLFFTVIYTLNSGWTDVGRSFPKIHSLKQTPNSKCPGLPPPPRRVRRPYDFNRMLTVLAIDDMLWFRMVNGPFDDRKNRSDYRILQLRNTVKLVGKVDSSK